MRTLLAGVAGLLAVILLPVALLVAWVASVGTDTNLFVAKMTPVVSTPQVQHALTDQVVAIVQQQLKLPPQTAQQIDAPLRALAAQAVARPEVKQAWASGLRGAHQEFVAIMEGREPARVDATGRVVMPVKIRLSEAATALRAFGILDQGAFTATVPVPLFAAADLAPARRIYAIGATAGPGAPWVVVGLAVVALVLARRRGRAAVLLGIGGVVGAAALAAALVAGRGSAAHVVADPTGAALLSAAYGLAEDGLMADVRLAGWVSAALVAAGLVAGAFGVFRGRRG